MYDFIIHSNVSTNVGGRGGINANIIGSVSGMSNRVFNDTTSTIGSMHGTVKAALPTKITTAAARKMHPKTATPQKYILQGGPNLTNLNHPAACTVTYRSAEATAPNRMLANPTSGKSYSQLIECRILLEYDVAKQDVDYTKSGFA